LTRNQNTLHKSVNNYYVGNSHIRFQNKTVIFNGRVESGILYVNDVINNEGCIDSTCNIILEKTNG